MAKEIERKFVVRDTSVLVGRTGQHIVQGYLSVEPVTTRVRVVGDSAFLTVKGPPTGITCDEFEYPIPRDDAAELLRLCGPHVVEKTRYEIPVEGLVFEVDVFEGRHAGLILAEVELPDEHARVVIPDWIDREVSRRREYSNAYLALSSTFPGAR